MVVAQYPCPCVSVLSPSHPRRRRLKRSTFFVRTALGRRRQFALSAGICKTLNWTTSIIASRVFLSARSARPAPAPCRRRLLPIQSPSFPGGCLVRLILRGASPRAMPHARCKFNYRVRRFFPVVGASR